MIKTLDDFVKKYDTIRNKWIVTHRNGSTGVGKTLEDLLEIKENNIDGPDFGDYELKSCRIESNSMLTMFTKTPKPRGSANLLRTSFGYIDKTNSNNEKVLHVTLSANGFTKISDTDNQLKINCDEEKISIVDSENNEHAYWTREQLKKAFEKKYKNKFVYVKAESRENNNREEFYYKNAYEVSGFDYDKFVNLLEKGKICIDLRIGQYHDGKKKGKTHDHGTAFRIKEKNHSLLFKNIKKLA